MEMTVADVQALIGIFKHKDVSYGVAERLVKLGLLAHNDQGLVVTSKGISCYEEHLDD